MTFAEYARRGFGELTVVASASVILILVSERFGKREGRTNIIRLITLAIIVAVLFLLGSAFNRVLLYEDAYGFTTARLYAQSYMLVVALALIALGIELRNQMSPSRFFRRTFAAGTAVFIVLLYWNHSAWIASRNIDRFATTGKLDTRYLASELSLDAVPAIVERLPVIPEPTQTELRNAIRSRHAKHPKLLEMKWYEWNSRRADAAQALLKLQ
jgi:multisubunit Na+/H+ antiporter MnhB subunit